ncbi:Hypothetical protein A7982_03232 [Minicystis rosea]|nr:Hypothetical protein A7982_03232 [Minicystis rosea]
MATLTIAYGAALTGLGIGGFVATKGQHKTALIPAGFGAVAIGIGLMGKRRPAALLAGSAVAALALAGSARGLTKLPALLRGEEVERPAAVVAQSAMAGVSALYLVMRAIGRS